MNTAAKFICVTLAFIFVSVSSFWLGTKLKRYEEIQSIQSTRKTEISSKIQYEIINVDYCHETNRIKIPQGWIVRDNGNTFFVPDSNHIWKITN